MELTSPYIADAVVGRLSWAHIVGEDTMVVDRLVERVHPYAYAQVYVPGAVWDLADTKRVVQDTLEELVDVGIVMMGEPDRGERTYHIAVPDHGPGRDDNGWRDQAAQVACAIVDGQHRLIDMDGRTALEGFEDDAPTVDARALLDAVRTLDLLDRAGHR